MAFKEAVILCLVCACCMQMTAGYSLRTQIPVIEPPAPLLDIGEYLQSAEQARYTDDEKQLTAIKDKKFSSCFVNEYDPMWNLRYEDKADIVSNQPHEIEQDFNKLKKKTGEIIAKMCLKYKLFWLTNPPQPNMAGASPDMPPPMRTDGLVDPPMIGQDLLEPPMSNTGPSRDSDFDPRIPPQINALPDLIEPPKQIEVIQTPPPLSDLFQGPLMNWEPPMISDNDSQAPPKLSQDILVPPPLKDDAGTPSLDGNMQAPPMRPEIELAPPAIQNSNFQEPPRISDLIEPPKIERTIPKNARAFKAGNGSENKPEMYTQAPPTPDFRHPDSFRWENLFSEDNF